jgi:hypothetical protein
MRQLWSFASGDAELMKLPWVINTMGFTQGADLGKSLKIKVI